MLRCTSVQLEAGQLTGQIDKALLQVFKRPKDAQEAREPRATERKPGLIRQTVHGDVQRTGRDTFILRDAQFTLCDCGENETPSWRLRASEINLDLNDRATLWWPRIDFHVFGLFMLPIPAPTPVLSMPLADRAAGFLAPRLSFLKFPYPTLDLPLFLPVTDAYDITLTPGIRSTGGSIVPIRYQPGRRPASVRESEVHRLKDFSAASTSNGPVTRTILPPVWPGSILATRVLKIRLWWNLPKQIPVGASGPPDGGR